MTRLSGGARSIGAGVVLTLALTVGAVGESEAAPATRDCADVTLGPAADLRFCDFASSTTLSGHDLTGADLRHADLTHARVGGNPDAATVLDGANLSHVAAVGADLSDLIIRGVDFRHADFTAASFETASLSGVDARHARLDGFFFGSIRDSDLRGADLSGAALSYTAFLGVDLRRADLRGATVDGVHFSRANLRNAFGLASAAGLETVVWQNTTCPDGTDSEHNGGTCLGHLGP